MKLKKTFLTAASVGIATLLMACSAPGDEVVLSIGDYELTQSEYYELLRDEAYTEDFTYGEVILEQHILTNILEDKYGSEIDEKEIEEALKEFIDGFESEDGFKEFLESENLNEEDMKQNMRMQKLIIAALKDFHPLEEEELEQMYEDMVPIGKQIRHILVLDEAEALEIIEKIENGEDFVELMEEYTMDEASLENDGLMPLYRGMYVPEFEEAALALREEGAHSGVVETDNGYHIIELVTKGTKGTFEEEQNRLESMYYEELMQTDQDIYPQVMNQLLKEYETEIDIHDDAMSNLVEKVLKVAELEKQEREEFEAMMEEQELAIEEHDELEEVEVIETEEDVQEEAEEETTETDESEE